MLLALAVPVEQDYGRSGELALSAPSIPALEAIAQRDSPEFEMSQRTIRTVISGYSVTVQCLPHNAAQSIVLTSLMTPCELATCYVGTES
jgi:hypothetical protein